MTLRMKWKPPSTHWNWIVIMIVSLLAVCCVDLNLDLPMLTFTFILRPWSLTYPFFIYFSSSFPCAFLFMFGTQNSFRTTPTPSFDSTWPRWRSADVIMLLILLAITLTRIQTNDVRDLSASSTSTPVSQRHFPRPTQHPQSHHQQHSQPSRQQLHQNTETCQTTPCDFDQSRVKRE